MHFHVVILYHCHLDCRLLEMTRILYQGCQALTEK